MKCILFVSMRLLNFRDKLIVSNNNNTIINFIFSFYAGIVTLPASDHIAQHSALL